MKLWLSQPHERTGKRQLVLDMTRREEHEVFDTLRRQVIRGRAPARNVRRDGSVRYRFPREHMDRLLATFPYVELSPGLNRRMARAAQREMAGIEVPDLDLPDFHTELYDFQKIGVQAILDGLKENHSFFLNDDMGLGKTVQALAVMVKLTAVPALVICPNGPAKWGWQRMVERFTDFNSVLLDSTCQTKAQRTALIKQRQDVTIVNVEALRSHPELSRIEYGLIVTDEVHRFKNPKAAQTKAWHELEGSDHLMMTGTPMINRVEEIWSALHAAFPERYPDYYLFERWLCLKSKAMWIPERDHRGNPVFCFHPLHQGGGQCRARHTHHGNSTRPATVMKRIPGKVIGYKPESFKQLKTHVHDPGVSIRRRKDQVLDDLPDVVYSTLLVDLTREQRRLYSRIVDDMRLELENGEIRTINQMIAVVTRCKQACFSPELYGGGSHSQKLDELKLLVQELVDSGRKALIGSQWARATRIMQRELREFNPAYVDGQVKGQRRQDEVDRFNEDEECLMYIGTIQANQEFITLSPASDVIFTDKMWSPLYNDQFIGRSAAGGLRGVGSEHSTVNVIELFARDTIEERIEHVLSSKRNLFNAFVETDGGALREHVTVGEIAKLF